MGWTASFTFACSAFREDFEALAFRARLSYVLWVRELCCAESKEGSPGPALVFA